MAKGAKPTIKQTDYTVGGRDISNTAVPMYTENLNRLNDYLGRDYTETIDKYLDYSNDVSMNDMLRNYQRAIGDTAASNYSATGGGYTSSGQRAIDDQQRYFNDLAARIAAQNLSNASVLAQNEYSNLTNAFNPLQVAYGEGANFSNVDQYNDQVKQYNKNAGWNNLLGIGGSILGTVGGAMLGNPMMGYTIGSGIGSSLGNMVSPVDPSVSNALLHRVAGVQGQNTGAGLYDPRHVLEMVNLLKGNNNAMQPTTNSINVNNPVQNNKFQGLI